MSLNEKHLSMAGVIVAIVALLVSIKSCHQSDKALEFQRQDHVNAVTTAWKGDVNKDELTIKITPTNDKVVMQKAMVTFPDAISDVVWPIEMPDHVLHMASQMNAIQDLVEQRIPKSDGNIIMLDDSRIPVVVESRYIANATLFEDRSLYSIEYNAIVWPDEHRKPGVILNGISFFRRLSADEHSKKVLNDLWEQGGAQIPIK
ncbi:hypothetical protein [Pseudoalteromonas sp. T1lg22]|uniref:hypothetical protein n=1 Tax=Pseudoalteromonas sp. T1lg22 TaxID=2077096 RepID=UPI00131A187E|nr:hypothetical protein [Pseudoalteromonas sp. T1lg22]